MVSEQCALCGDRVPFDATVHVMMNARGEVGVIEGYVCRECFEGDLEPLFERSESAH